VVEVSDYIDSNKLFAIRAIIDDARANARLASETLANEIGHDAFVRLQAYDWFLSLLDMGAKNSVEKKPTQKSIQKMTPTVSRIGSTVTVDFDSSRDARVAFNDLACIVGSNVRRRKLKRGSD
jgi:hypothetical protein